MRFMIWNSKNHENNKKMDSGIEQIFFICICIKVYDYQHSELKLNEWNQKKNIHEIRKMA